jgi:uncharacterized protein (TIGR02246 family)
MQLALKIAAAPITCLLFFTLFAHSSPEQDAGLSPLRESWILAFKMGDAAKAASFFTADATIMPPGFPSTTGRKAIEQFYSDAFVILSMRDFEIHSKEHRQDGPNTLRDHGTYKATWVPKDGSAPYSVTGRYLIIAKRQSDGHWLISWEMHTIESKVPADQL